MAYLCAAPCAPLLRRRFGSEARIESVPAGEPLTIGSARVSFHPAGHVLGSAQIRVESADGVWVVSGDYKRDADPTCALVEPVRCDTFITESTFGLPIYRWDPPSSPAKLIDLDTDAGRHRHRRLAPRRVLRRRGGRRRSGVARARPAAGGAFGRQP